MSYLEISTRDTRYVYPTGRVRGLEKYLLKDVDLARIREGKDLAESFQNATHFYPYSESMKICENAHEFERGLEEEWRRTYLELKCFTPEPDLVELFWLEQDFHNMKILFKLYAQQKLPQSADEVANLSTCGTLSPSFLINIMIKKDFLSLSSFLRAIFRELTDKIEKGIRAREMDLFLDKLYLQKLLSESAKFKDPFLAELAEMLVDIANIKNLIRIKLWNKDREEESKLIDASIIDGGEIKKIAASERAGDALDSLVEFARGTKYERILQKALDEWKEKHSLFNFERSLEEILISFTHRGFYITFGREPLINYIILKKIEIKKLRAILRAKKAHFSEVDMQTISF